MSPSGNPAKREEEKMPRANHAEETELYRSLDANSGDEKNVCAVIAVAILANVSYDDAHRVMADLGRVEGKRTPNRLILHALRHFGCKLKRVNPQAIIAQYPKAHQVLNSVTTHHPKRFPKVWGELPPLWIRTNGHCAAFKNGELHDWSVSYTDRVREIYEVIPPNERS